MDAVTLTSDELRARARLPIELVLPYPISANRYWRTYMPKGFKAPVTTLSKEAKAYKAEVASLAKVAGIREPLSGRVAVSYVLFPQRPLDYVKRMRMDPEGWDDTVQCIDLDNAQKVLMDSLKGVVIDDDKWVRRIEAERAEPDGVARMVVRVWPLESSRVQSDLFNTCEHAGAGL